MKTTAIILAAGTGSRFGQNKMMIQVCGASPWQILQDKVYSLVKSTIVVGVDIRGGPSRADSVKAGLEYVDTERVLIVDAARFLVREIDFKKILDCSEDAVSFGRPLTNTVIPLFGPPRDKSFELHTPQTFNTAKLIKGIDAADSPYTDEYSLMIQDPRHSSKLLAGNWRTGLKMTRPEDLDLMRAAWGQV